MFSIYIMYLYFILPNHLLILEDRARQLKLEIHIWQQKNKVWMDNEDAINLNNKVTLDKDFYGINNQ